MGAFADRIGDRPPLSQRAKDGVVEQKNFRHKILDRDIGGTFPIQNIRREPANGAAHLHVIRAEIEECAAADARRQRGEHRNLGPAGGIEDKLGRHRNRHIAADPDGLDTAGDEGVGGFERGSAVLRVGFNEGDAQVRANLAGDLRLRERVGFGGIPDEAHGLEFRPHLPGSAEGGSHRLEAAVAGEIGRMNGVVRGLDTHTRAERIGDEAEDVRCVAADLVGVGDGLQGNRAEADDEVVRTAGDLLRDGVGRADVRLGVETSKLDAVAIGVAARRQHLKEAAPALVERGQRRGLNEGHAKDFAGVARPARGPPRAVARAAIRVKQHARGQRDENHAEGKTFDGFAHRRKVGVTVPVCGGARSSGAVHFS